ncbi:MAG: VanZ family protein [Actinomycetota bacterium]|nr:VanZ family protein [Actinomycetota bacterium]
MAVVAAVDLVGPTLDVLELWPWVLERFLGQRDVVVTLAVGLVAAVVLGPPLARREHTSAFLVVLALAASAVVVAATIVPERGYPTLAGAPIPAPGWASWWRGGWDPDPAFLVTGIDGPFNIMLFAPAGALWTAAVRRPTQVWAALVAASIIIETLQAFTGLREASVNDVVANGIGAGIGVVVGIVWSAATDRLTRTRPSPTTRGDDR